MEPTKIPLRDFIYLDGDRLQSLYSQVFEGFAENVIQSYVDGLAHTKTQKGASFSGTNLTSEVAEVTQRTENKLLYDHMYNQFEERIGPGLFPGNSITRDDINDQLMDALAMKVTGTVEIEDFSRMIMYFDKFNDLGEAIAYSAINSDTEFLTNVKSMTDLINQNKDRNERAKQKEILRSMTDVKKYAKENGLAQEKQLLDNLKLFSELFAKNQYFVTFNPPSNVEKIFFRAIVDTKWLRVEPSQLRALYGNSPQCKWTLVGQVTHIPTEPIASLPVVSTDHSNQQEDLNPETNITAPPSMRDPFRAMFKSSDLFEKMFLESNNRCEIIVFPLAIYREFNITPNT